MGQKIRCHKPPSFATASFALFYSYIIPIVFPDNLSPDGSESVQNLLSDDLCVKV